MAKWHLSRSRDLQQPRPSNYVGQRTLVLGFHFLFSLMDNHHTALMYFSEMTNEHILGMHGMTVESNDYQHVYVTSTHIVLWYHLLQYTHFIKKF